MDFPTLHQHIDTLLEQERCVDAQILIDEQITRPKYLVLTRPKQTHLSLWEEKWQLQLLTCKSLIIQFKPNETVSLVDKIFEESQLLDSSKTLVKGKTVKAYALIYLGRIQECQKLINEAESSIENLEELSQAEITSLQAALERTKGYVNNIFGNFEQALTQFQNSLHLSRQNRNNSWSVQASLILQAQVYGDMGLHSKGLELLQNSVEYNKNHGLEYSYIWNLFILAIYLYLNMGQFALAKEYALESLKLCKKKDSELIVAWGENTLGLIYRQHGELTKAESLLLSSISGFKSVESYWYHVPTGHLSDLYRMQGNYEQAIIYLNESLKGAKAVGYQVNIGYLTDRLGDTYRSHNQLQEASIHYEQALEIKNSIGNKTHTARTLFKLILLRLETGESANAEQQLKRLKEIAEQENNPIIANRTHLADALYQMQSPKLLDKAQAQQKLRNLIQQQDLEVDLLIIAYLNLFELYIIEWKVSEDEATLDEIYQLLDQMQEFAKNQSMLPLEVELHLLRAFLALVQGNLPQADSQVTEAIQIAQTHEFTHLIVKSQELHTKIQSQVKEWQSLLDENVSITRLLEKTEMEEYLKAAMRIKYSKD